MYINIDVQDMLDVAHTHAGIPMTNAFRLTLNFALRSYFLFFPPKGSTTPPFTSHTSIRLLVFLKETGVESLKRQDIDMFVERWKRPFQLGIPMSELLHGKQGLSMFAYYMLHGDISSFPMSKCLCPPTHSIYPHNQLVRQKPFPLESHLRRRYLMCEPETRGNRVKVLTV